MPPTDDSASRVTEPVGMSIAPREQTNMTLLKV